MIFNNQDIYKILNGQLHGHGYYMGLGCKGVYKGKAKVCLYLTVDRTVIESTSQYVSLIAPSALP